ncbi:MAG: FtsW/RodA/SpoVE family cell cycle protein [Rickettsiales bacterium]|nr:FtsW/RodA/SpoVE family cell cycle protein [Rickettsiales bacterium]
MFNRDKKNFFSNWWFTIDRRILSIFLLLNLFGLLAVFSAGMSVADDINASTEYFFIRKQIVFTVFSIIIAIVMSFFDEKIAKFSIPFYFLVSLILLTLIPFWGYSSKGSKRWIYIFGFSLQPTEFVKSALLMVNAIFLAISDRDKKNKKLIFIGITFSVFVIYLLYKQPDIGNCFLLLFAVFTQAFFLDSFTRKLLIKCFVLFVILLLITYFSFPHVYLRINDFMVSFSNVEKAQYQVKSSIAGYRNSGFLGRGFMEGEVKRHIPDAHTDFILPVISEEFGFCVIFMILVFYLYLFCRIILKALTYSDKTIVFILIGLAFLFIFQVIINTGVSLNLLPTKGITIPFLSYGGSSLVSNAINFGYIFIFTKSNVLRKKIVENEVITQ